MKLRNLMVLTALAVSPAVMGADSTDRTSPLDKNAACMDRTTDASTGNCVVKDEGTPRQTYPPKKSPASAIPVPARTIAAPTERKSTSGK